MADTEATNENVPKNDTQDKGQIFKVWKFDCNLSLIKSIKGIFMIALIVLSLLCLIILSSAKKVACYASFPATYGFYNFAYGSCLLTYVLRFILSVLFLDTNFLKFVPWLVWDAAVSLFFAILFFFASIAVVAAPDCGTRFSGYQAAAAFGFITFFVMAAEFVFHIIQIRKEHPPTENRILLMIGVERTPPGTAPAYDADTNASNAQTSDPKY